MASPIESFSLQWCVNDLLRKGEKVDTIHDKVLALDDEVRVIEESQLESFGIRRLAALDIDLETIDLEPIFFRPYPADLPSWGEFRSAVQAQKRLGRRVDYICQWSTVCRPETREHDLCAGPLHDANWRLEWFYDALESASNGPGADRFLEKNTDWRLCRTYPCDMEQHRLPAHRGGPPEAVGDHLEEDQVRYRFEYDLVYCFLPTEELDKVSVWTPRVKGAVIQSHEAGDVLLRSELHSALHMLVHMFDHGMEDYHHTIPVLIYSFHQDKTARVTQFHFNGEHLLFRQSRLLDLAADEPTEDAYLLLRWMASLPEGETTFTALNELVESQTIDTDDGGEKDALPISPRPKSTREGLSAGA
ncbi:hypothetical protein V8F33_005493 [Rhypophila sp. PSN 637]